MKSIVLLSSGLDSTVNFCKAIRETDVILALTFDYGQRATRNEILFSRKICKHYHVNHKVVRLDWLKLLTKTALVNQKKKLPIIQKSQLDNVEKIHKTAEEVWVPNRNGVFVQIGASFAEGLDADQIVVGFNAEEAITFPDNSIQFLERVNEVLQYSTLRKLRVVCYTSEMKKDEIVRLGKELQAPFEWMWSCYESGKKICKKCESCLRFLRAMERADI